MTVLVSIVTPCLNRAGFIAEAIESVQKQDHPRVEHIIMDGGSTDGTLELLGRHPHLRLFSEPDKGIFDALNKGIRRARGEIIGFLNTDDLYEPNTFGRVAQAFLDNPEADAVVGGASIFCCDARGRRTGLATFPYVGRRQLLMRSTWGAPVFNAWFFRKQMLDELGLFDSGYLYVADRDLLLRMAFENVEYATLDRTLYHYRMHSGSYTLSGRDSGEAGYMFECRALAERHLRLKGVSPEALSCFRAWHSQLTLEQMLTAWRKRGFHRVAGYALAGLRYNPLGWPKVLVETCIERFSVMVRGGASVSTVDGQTGTPQRRVPSDRSQVDPAPQGAIPRPRNGKPASESIPGPD